MDVNKVVEHNKEIFERITDVLMGYLDALLQHLPRVIIGLVIFIVSLFIAKSVKTLVVKIFSKFTKDPSLLSLFGSIGYVLTIGLGILIAGATIIPGLQAGDLIAVLGLSSVAGGFAFKDIIENFLAGILILIRRPFTIRDEIECAGISGVVEDITFRTTMIRTYNGVRVVVPNATVFKSSIVVTTDAPIRRSSFKTGIAYTEDVNTARAVILNALETCDAVLKDPHPVALCWSHDDSAIAFDVRYWTNSEMKYVVAAHDQVATAIKYALDEAEIEIPYNYLTLDYPMADVLEEFGNRYLKKIEKHAELSVPMHGAVTRHERLKKSDRLVALPTSPDEAEPVSATNQSEGEEEHSHPSSLDRLMHHDTAGEGVTIDVLRHTKDHPVVTAPMTEDATDERGEKKEE